ncbi:MAG TPA: ImmA/IrrE family metallo-endopeptidase [Fimbriimonas sp.]|nr:ImmA/IrrE family metallo-endopeptidase [Fimbriimonas sp.]
MARRDEILKAVYEADRLHKEYDAESRAKQGEGRIDVFGMLVKREIPVIFRPLKNLLGAYINDPSQGVMVTTQRQLPVQRFTAAHELGHAALGHEASLDEEDILMRALFDPSARFDSREIQANAFATELLTPQWLIVEHMNRQGWSRDDLSNAIVVYQLSLRMGSSYTATCYALQECKGLDHTTCDKLLKANKKSIKQALAKPYAPDKWYGDVWLVTERDNGLVLEGSRSDLVVVRMPEHASSGYVWQFGGLADTGLAIRDDGRVSEGSKHIGGIVFRTVIAEAEDGARGHVRLRETRPWQTDGHPLNSMELDVDLSGPVPAGLLPQQREALLEVA